MFFTLSPFTGARIETVPSRGYRDGSFPEDYELILRWIDQGARIGKFLKFFLNGMTYPHGFPETIAAMT